MKTVKQVLVTCPCGMLPLADAHQATPGDAWKVAAAHVALNPSLCHPAMNWVNVPVRLAHRPKSK